MSVHCGLSVISNIITKTYLNRLRLQATHEMRKKRKGFLDQRHFVNIVFNKAIAAANNCSI